MNKVVFVKAHFLPVGEEKIFQVPTGEKKKYLLGGETDIMKEEKRWVQTGFSDCGIDGERLAKDLQGVIESLNKDSYEVVSVTEITSGKYEYNPSSDYSYGYGYSYTDGLMVVARKV